jgi:hypothetical protein
LDDDFFSQLENVRQEQAEQEQQAQKAAAASAKRKHTTFVFSQDDKEHGSGGAPVKVDGNIEVVVLGDAATHPAAANGMMAAATSNVVSDEAMLYSRNGLVDGYDVDGMEVSNNNHSRHSKKRPRREGETTPWQRSKRNGAFMRRKGKPSVFFTRNR